MPSASRCPPRILPELRARLDEYARTHLTLADFEPSLNCDAELPLDHVTPEFFKLLQRLEPFGVGNPQPVFTARAVRLMASPRIIKDKHVKLKLAPADWIVVPRLGWAGCEPPDYSALRSRFSRFAPQ